MNEEKIQSRQDAQCNFRKRRQVTTTAQLDEFDKVELATSCGANTSIKQCTSCGGS